MTADDSDVLRHVGALVEACRQGRPAADVAKEAGVNVKTLRALEQGQSWPWAASQQRIERALGLDKGTLELWRRDERARDLAWESIRSPSERRSAPPAPAVPAETPAVEGIPGQELVRLGYVALIHERLRALPAEDVAEMWELVNQLGQRRFADWDQRFSEGGSADLAWSRRPVLPRAAGSGNEGRSRRGCAQVARRGVMKSHTHRRSPSDLGVGLPALPHWSVHHCRLRGVP